MGEVSSKRQWILAAVGILMIAAAVRIAIGSRTPAESAAPPVRSDAPPLALYVQHDGPALRLHWNPDADAVRRAASGALLITDGQRQSRLDLAPAELTAGLASYWPESRAVDFRLELDGVVAGQLQAPVLAVREEEPDSSPAAISVHEPLAKRAAPTAHAAAPDDDVPKPHTERAGATHEADREADDAPEPAHKPSRWHRLTRKIPLVRRVIR
jgi:hypothetical protein